MREITSHKLTGLNDALKITVLDEPGPGGANHRYRIEPTTGNALGILVEFQNGPLQETVYPNGVSNEALLALVIDRMQGFQRGQFSCRENALALTKLEEAMHWMQHRTRERMSRGVEGTNQK
jgi:hypothetical protein